MKPSCIVLICQSKVLKFHFTNLSFVYLFITLFSKVFHPTNELKLSLPQFTQFSRQKTPQTLSLRGLKYFFELRTDYLFENCGALLAFLRPYFFLSFILGSLVRKPAFLRAGLYSPSISRRALEIPCLIAPA